VFGDKAMQMLGLRCEGKEPWLRGRGEGCLAESDETLRVLQRGASNVYWSCIESALSIPPFAGAQSDPLAIFGSLFSLLIRETIQKSDEGDAAATASLPPLLIAASAANGIDSDAATCAVEAHRRSSSDCGPGKRDREGRKWEEYLSFLSVKTSPAHDAEFHVKVSQQGSDVDPLFQDHIDAILLAYKLREVRAQTAFTRIQPPGGDFASPNAPRGRLRRTLGKAAKDRWLPASEIRGEGIFIDFRLDAVDEWEQSKLVQERFAEHKRRLESMPHGFEPPTNHSARMLMLHAFAHALMRELSLECGYSSAALVERIYAGPNKDHPDRKMAGVLVYTGSPDAGGTLGGLVRRGRQEFIIPTLKRVLQEVRWCSTDPLCISAVSSISVPTNLAACHGCLLAPETSCEYPFFNGFLDRAMLVGTPEHPEIGFFHEVIRDLDSVSV